MAALGTVSARTVKGGPKAYRAGGEGSVAALALAAPPAGPAEATAPAAVELEVHHNISPLLPEWRQFEEGAFSTLYQSALWCQAWTETVGAAAGARPAIVVGRQAGRICFILPLQVRRRMAVSVIEWLGAPIHGYGYPVIEPGFLPRARAWFDDNLSAVIALAGPVDAVCLSENPHQFLDQTHPLAGHFNIAGPSPSFAMALQPDFEALHRRKRSGERRRSSRKSENGLRQMGNLHFGLPDGKQARHGTIKAMFLQQEERLAEKGVYHVFGAAERAFIHRLIDLEDHADPILAPFRLTLNGETVAVMLGGLHKGSYWALISSLASGAVRRHSPGEVALRLTIEACCKQGLTRFDFSTGEADYKRQWSDGTIELSVVLKACTYRGLAWASGKAAKLAAKRLVKRTPWLHHLALSLRQSLRGRQVRP